MVGPVTDVAEKVTILVTRETAVLTCLAFLTLPTSPDSFRDFDVSAAVEVVLAAGGAVEQVLVLLNFELLHFAELPRLAVVVVISGLVS